MRKRKPICTGLRKTDPEREKLIAQIILLLEQGNKRELDLVFRFAKNLINK